MMQTKPRKRVPTWVLAVLLAGLIAGLQTPWTEIGAAMAKQAEEIRIGRMALVLCHSPAVLFDRKGFLDKHGVDDYELKFFTKGSQSALALGAGETDVAFFGAIIPAIVNGLDAKILAVNSHGGVQLVCNEPDVRSLADLKGKRVGNIGPTASPTSIFSLALKEAGVPRATMEHVSINRRNIVVALTEKEYIDCAVLIEPLTTEELKRGAHMVLDEKELYNNGDYPFTFFVAKNDYIEGNREIVQRVLKALRSSQEFINNNGDEAVRLMAQYFKENGIDYTTEEIAHGLATNSFHPEISRSVMEKLIKVLFDSGVIEREISFEDLVDCSFGTCVD